MMNFVTFESVVLKFELMFYTRAYLKIEGEKRQGKRSKTDF